MVLLLATALAGAAGLWSSPEMVGPDDDYDSIFPNVEVSPDGIVWIAWSAVDPVQTDEEVYCVRVEDLVQSPPERVHPNNGSMDRCPLMSMGWDGVPWVLWERYSSSLGYIQVESHWTGSGWAPPDTVFTQGSRWDEYTIHASSSNDVWVAKSSRTDGRVDRDIFLRHWDGVSWGTTELVGFDGWEDMNPALTTDGAGRTWLAWLRYDMTTRLYRHFVYASVRDDDGWNEPALVDTGPGNLVVWDLNTIPGGSPVVVWGSAGTAPRSDLKYAVLEDGSWEHGGLVNQPDDPNVDSDASARLNKGPNEDLWVTWTSSVWGVTPKAITASQWLGDGWSDEELVSAPDMQSLKQDYVSDVAVAGDGRVWVAWQRRQETSPYDTDIYVAYREVTTGMDVWGLATEPIGGSIRLTWQASPDVAQEGLHVWRARGDACSSLAGSIPAAAERLTATPIRGCTSCAFVDDAARAGEHCCYWLEQPGSGRVFGPVAAIIPATPSPVSFSVSPNPAGAGVVFQVTGARSPGEVRIFTAGGRAVAALPLPSGGADGQRDETMAIPWDGTSTSGHTSSSGGFYAVLREQAIESPIAHVRFVLVR